MDKKKRGISKVKSIISEIAYDLGIDKKLVRQVLLLTFKEFISKMDNLDKVEVPKGYIQIDAKKNTKKII